MLSILCSIITIILLIIDFIKYQTRRNRINKIVAILTSIITFLTVLNVPKPKIYRINEKSDGYMDGIKIEIICKNFPLYETFYSLDGTNPQNGYKYEEPFIIYEDSKVVAITKFLWWWSDTDNNLYSFENLKFDNMSKSPDYTDIQGNMESQEIWESEISIESEDDLTSNSQDNSEEDSNYQEYMTESVVDEIVNPPQITESTNINEGLNPSEGYNLMKYINQERQKVGIEDLVWNSDLVLKAQNIVTQYVEFGDILIIDDSFYVIGRQCNGAKNAETAVSHWITGNNWIPSEAENLLNSNYTQIGGALYYLPNGNEYGYHYFWIICLQ